MLQVTFVLGWSLAAKSAAWTNLFDMPLVTLVLELELISSLFEYSPLPSSETAGIL
jgi:hypothetical protein